MDLSNIKTFECRGCSNGIRMCHTRPCWGTPTEFRKIIDEGFAHKLMIDFWIGRGDSEVDSKNPYKYDVPFLCGAILGSESSISPLISKGTCALLTNDNKCSVHHIKPIQGKYSCCKDNDPEDNKRMDILATWDTEEGRELIDEWTKIVGYEGKIESKKLEINEDMMELFLNLLENFGIDTNSLKTEE